MNELTIHAAAQSNMAQHIELTADKVQAQRGAESEQQLRAAVSEFESLFIHEMLSAMRKTVPEDGLIPTNTAENIFEDMLDEEIAKMSSQAGGIGLAEMLYQQLAADAYGRQQP